MAEDNNSRYGLVKNSLTYHHNNKSLKVSVIKVTEEGVPVKDEQSVIHNIDDDFVQKYARLLMALIHQSPQDRFTLAQWVGVHEENGREESEILNICKQLNENVDWQALFWKAIYKSENVYGVFRSKTRHRVLMKVGKISDVDRYTCSFSEDVNGSHENPIRLDWLRILPRTDFNFDLYQEINKDNV